MARSRALSILVILPSLLACSASSGVEAEDDRSCGAGCDRAAAGGASASRMPGVAGFPQGAAGAAGAILGAAAHATAGGAGQSAGGSSSASGSSASGGKAGTSAGGGKGGASAGGKGGAAGAPSSGGVGGAAGSAPSGGGAGSKAGAGGEPAAGSARVIGYFAAWSVYGRDYHVADLPAAQLTHVNYAFANVSAAGEIELGDPYADTDKAYPGDGWEPGQRRGSFHQLELLKQKHPHLKAMISVGGWTWSGRFSDVALTAASRKKFAASCAAFVEAWGFDGVDVDWEYPVTGGLDTNQRRPEDGHNYTLLLAELRQALDQKGEALGRRLELSIAAPAGPAIYEGMELAELSKSTDFINIMAYDFQGGWSPRTGFNAPLYAAPEDPSPASERDSLNVAAAASAYVARGVARDKIVIGVPFYGRGWAGVTPTHAGLFQPFSGLPQGTWEAGVFDWKDLAANYLPKATRTFHAGAQVPWLFDAKSGLMISYDDPESIGLKAGYVKQEGLGGVMIWEMSGDDDQRSLLTAVTHALAP